MAGALNGVREAKQRGLGRTAGRGRSWGWRPDRVAPAGTRLPRLRLSLRQVLHEPLIDEDPVFIATCTERELRKRKKRKFSLWVRQCSSTGFIVQVGRAGGRRGAGRAGHPSAHVPAHGACRVLRQRLDAGWGRPRPSGRQGGRPRPRHGPSATAAPASAERQRSGPSRCRGRAVSPEGERAAGPEGPPPIAASAAPAPASTPGGHGRPPRGWPSSAPGEGRRLSCRQQPGCRGLEGTNGAGGDQEVAAEWQLLAWAGCPAAGAPSPASSAEPATPPGPGCSLGPRRTRPTAPRVGRGTRTPGATGLASHRVCQGRRRRGVCSGPRALLRSATRRPPGAGTCTMGGAGVSGWNGPESARAQVSGHLLDPGPLCPRGPRWPCHVRVSFAVTLRGDGSRGDFLPPPLLRKGPSQTPRPCHVRLRGFGVLPTQPAGKRRRAGCACAWPTPPAVNAVSSQPEVTSVARRGHTRVGTVLPPPTGARVPAEARGSRPPQCPSRPCGCSSGCSSVRVCV